MEPVIPLESLVRALLADHHLARSKTSDRLGVCVCAIRSLTVSYVYCVVSSCSHFVPLFKDRLCLLCLLRWAVASA
eukprot:276754-Amphidinium_carterae.2